MPHTLQNNHYLTLRILALSVIAISVLFAYQGDKGFDLWDEGFLWYGAQRVMLGEVPIRDFMAYDPGRYYWSAAWMSTLGDNGIMSLRIAVAGFQALGMFAGLMLIAQTAKGYARENILFLLFSAAILGAWMFPRHKLFDITLSILLIANLAFLAPSPSVRRSFIAGFGIGLIAFFGRNHGLYGVVGASGLLLWQRVARSGRVSFVKGLFALAAGMVLGLAPVFVLALAAPGFATALQESVRLLFEQKATNLPLPVPWPWTVDFSSEPLSVALRSAVIGTFFIGLAAFGPSGILWATIRSLQNRFVPRVLVAASFLALPYAHHAYSRADVGHLAQSIFPLMIGTLAFLSTRSAPVKWTLTAGLAIVSVWVMYVFHPGWQCHSSQSCVEVEISNDRLEIDPTTASEVALVRQLADTYAPDGRSFITVPVWPGAYALLARKSPMWEVYPLFPRSESFQEMEIQRIRESVPGFALIFDFPLDGRDDLRFRNTHPLIYNYVIDNFAPVALSGNPKYEIFTATQEQR